MTEFFNQDLINKTTNITNLLVAKNIRIVTAESCTGGLLAALLTEIEGASAFFERGFVTYSNLAKNHLLGVTISDLEKFGAVSSQVAHAMAIGAFKNSNANLAVAITGIAGPGGDTPTKPIGLVYISCFFNDKIIIERNIFSGNRSKVRLHSIEKAIDIINSVITV